MSLRQALFVLLVLFVVLVLDLLLVLDLVLAADFYRFVNFEHELLGFVLGFLLKTILDSRRPR